MTSWFRTLLGRRTGAEERTPAVDVGEPLRESVSRQDSIGVLSEFGEFFPFFDGDPVRHVVEVATTVDDQEAILFRLLTKAPDGDPRLLVHIHIRGIPARPRGEAQVNLVLELKEHRGASYRDSPSVDLVITAKLEGAGTDLPIEVSA